MLPSHGGPYCVIVCVLMATVLRTQSAAIAAVFCWHFCERLVHADPAPLSFWDAEAHLVANCRHRGSVSHWKGLLQWCPILLPVGHFRTPSRLVRASCVPSCFLCWRCNAINPVHPAAGPLRIYAPAMTSKMSPGQFETRKRQKNIETQLHHQLPIGNPGSFPRLLLPYAIFPSASIRYELMRRLQHWVVQEFQEPLLTVLFFCFSSFWHTPTRHQQWTLMDIGYTHLQTRT